MNATERWLQLKCNNGIKDQGARQQIHLKERKYDRIFRKTGGRRVNN
jgi:hypothetical protein